MARSKIVSFLLKELGEVLPPTLFFLVGFILIIGTTQLILEDYLVHLANFMLVVMGALVVGKAVLVANLLPFLGRYDTAPLIRPILFKTVVYTIVVFLARFLERLAEYLLGGGSIGAIPAHLATEFSWHRFAAVQVWIFVLFLIYTAITELDSRIGKGKLLRILFARRLPAEALVNEKRDAPVYSFKQGTARK